MRALRNIAAGITNEVRIVATPVLEKDYLLICIQRCLNRLIQLRADHHFSFNCHLPRIHDLYGWQQQTSVSLIHVHVSILSLFGIVITFYRRCGTAKQHFCAKQRRTINGGVSCIVPGSGILLLVGTIVLLVNDHKPEIFKGQQQCTACA